MTFDWQQHLRETARHLVGLASTPGWEAHARARRDELLADPVWSGLREEIVRVLREAKADGRDRAGAPAVDGDPAG